MSGIEDGVARVVSVRGMALAALTPLIGLAACGGGDQPPWKAAPPAKGPSAAEAGYVAPPALLTLRVEPRGVVLSGSAQPGAKVMLGTPTGETLSAQAGPDGRWTATAATSNVVRLYGLFMIIDGRKVQSEGYLALTPDGPLAELRAGGGARVMAPGSRPPRILAIDYDGDGGAVVSGVGTANADVGLRIDRASGGGSVVGAGGRFAIPLGRPLAAGNHAFEVAAEGGEDTVLAPTTRAAPLDDSVYRAARFDGGWRIDWATPGGGVQTTLLLDRRG